MTALLTDKEIATAADRYCEGTTYPSTFIAGAEFARSIYEARLAEDAKVRAGLVEALENAKGRFRLVVTAEDRGFGLRYITGCSETAIEDINAALAAAKMVE